MRTILVSLLAFGSGSVASVGAEIDLSLLGTTQPLVTRTITVGPSILGGVFLTTLTVTDVVQTPGQTDHVVVGHDGGTVNVFLYVDLVGEATAGLFSFITDFAASPAGATFSTFSFDPAFAAPDGLMCGTFLGQPTLCPDEFIMAAGTTVVTGGCQLTSIFCGTTPAAVGTGGAALTGVGAGSSVFDSSAFLLSFHVGQVGNDGTPNQPTAVGRFVLTVPPLGEGSGEVTREAAIDPGPILIYRENPVFTSPPNPSMIIMAPTMGDVLSLMVTVIEGTPASGDVDGDDDVDLTDFASFQLCFTGPVGQWRTPNCAAHDFDNDQDIDLTDFASFQLAFTGAH